MWKKIGDEADQYSQVIATLGTYREWCLELLTLTLKV